MKSLFVFPLFACLVSSVCLLVLFLPQFVIYWCCLYLSVVTVLLWSIMTCLEANLLLVLIEKLLICLLKVASLAFLQHLQLSFL